MKRILAATMAGIMALGSYASFAQPGDTSGIIGSGAGSTSSISIAGEENRKTAGEAAADLLSSREWQGTRVYDAAGNDLTEENSNFIGLAKYDSKNGLYEFFNKETGLSRGDSGTFFITNDGKFRAIISKTLNYQSVVEITEINEKLFTYKRIGKDSAGNSVEIFVEHVPYRSGKLSFTTAQPDLDSYSGFIQRGIDGDRILSQTAWRGTVALDESGNDVSQYNSGFLGLARYDYTTSKYEFFNTQTGASRGDYGYYDVLGKNKERAHVSLGFRYGAVLELTELNQSKFTYKRMGRDASENPIVITVEHVPYEGSFPLEFTH